MIRKILNKTNKIVTELIEAKTLRQLQEELIQINLYVNVEDLISLILLTSITLFTISLLLFSYLKINILLSLIILILPAFLMTSYVIHKKQTRAEQIEIDLIDYLRQVSSLLNVGLGIETSFDELSKTNKGYLNDEIKHALIEMSFSKTFNEAFTDMANRNQSDNLKYAVQIIIHSKESGGNLSEILEQIASDLNDNQTLKKERKASVTMSVMFLIISSVIATPFSFAMIRLYSDFLSTFGRSNPLTSIIPITSIGYMLIHAVLVSILIAIVMYSDYKKSIRYMMIILPSSIIVYYISQTIFKTVLGVS